MTFGLDFFDDAGDLRWSAGDHVLPLVDVWATGLLVPDSRSYPELTGATIACEVNPVTWEATITYPDGVPTITITSWGGVSAVFYGTVYVFLVSLPTSLETEYSYRILNADGTYALSAVTTALEFVESISTSAGTSNDDSCINYAYFNGPAPSYYATVNKAAYPVPPFVMIDLPAHPYFGGLMSIQGEGGGDVWILNIGGSFASAPTLYLFRPITPGAAPSTGVGMTLFDEVGDCIFSTEMNLLGFVAPPETPPIYEFDVPANDSGSVTIGNLDQAWTPATPLPTNTLVWVVSRQIVCIEDCEEPPKLGIYPRIVREWSSGICRYDTDDLMLRLHTKTSHTRNAIGTETFWGDTTTGGAYRGRVFIADKDRIL